jgi:hypothetical protein
MPERQLRYALFFPVVILVAMTFGLPLHFAISLRIPLNTSTVVRFGVAGSTDPACPAFHFQKPRREDVHNFRSHFRRTPEMREYEHYLPNSHRVQRLFDASFQPNQYNQRKTRHQKGSQIWERIGFR